MIKNDKYYVVVHVEQVKGSTVAPSHVTHLQRAQLRL